MYYRMYANNELPILQISSIEYAVCSNKTRFGPGKRSKFLICYVLSGEGVYNGTLVTKGNGFIITPDVIEHIYPNENNPWELLWFVSSDTKMLDLLKYYNANPKTLIFSFTFFDELEKLKYKVISYDMKTVNSAEILYHYFEVFKNHLSAENQIFNKTAAQRYLDFAVNYIKSNYDQDITIAKITTLLGISQPYLYRIFNEALGTSPKKFLIDYRMVRAKALLNETELTVSEVARSVGFEDPFSFSKCFSKKEGISPIKYRCRNKK